MNFNLRSLFGVNKHVSAQTMSYLNLPSKSYLKPIDYGEQVPNFCFTPVGSTPQNMSEWLKESAVVIVFFRGTWCPNCVRELRSVQEEIEDFEINNIEILAISPDGLESMMDFKSDEGIKYHLISDPSNRIAKLFNISVPLKDTVSRLNKSIIKNKFKIDVDEYEVPVPATYIIGKGGKVLYNFIDFDYTYRVDMKTIPDIAVKLIQEDDKMGADLSRINI